MKSKMRITGNRTVIGIICIVLALGITFGIAPLVNRFTDRKVEVVQVKQDVERGHLITEDDVELVKVGALNLSDRTVKNKKYVVGKYAATNLYAGQIMIADLVAEKSNSADDVLSALDGTKVAISVNIASFAQGLSNKLRNGDIVSVIVYDKETNQSHVPPELRYVKVITTTTGDSVDSDRKTDATQAITVTMLASPDQARRGAERPISSLMKSISFSSMNTPQTFSLPCGSVSASTVRSLRALRKMWRIFCKAIRQEPCWQTPNLWSCSIRLRPTVRSWQV